MLDDKFSLIFLTDISSFHTSWRLRRRVHYLVHSQKSVDLRSRIGLWWLTGSTNYTSSPVLKIMTRHSRVVGTGTCWSASFFDIRLR